MSDDDNILFPEKQDNFWPDFEQRCEQNDIHQKIKQNKSSPIQLVDLYQSKQKFQTFIQQINQLKKTSIRQDILNYCQKLGKKQQNLDSFYKPQTIIKKIQSRIQKMIKTKRIKKIGEMMILSFWYGYYQNILTGSITKTSKKTSHMKIGFLSLLQFLGQLRNRVCSVGQVQKKQHYLKTLGTNTNHLFWVLSLNNVTITNSNITVKYKIGNRSHNNFIVQIFILIKYIGMLSNVDNIGVVILVHNLKKDHGNFIRMLDQSNLYKKIMDRKMVRNIQIFRRKNLKCIKKPLYTYYRQTKKLNHDKKYHNHKNQLQLVNEYLQKCYIQLYTSQNQQNQLFGQNYQHNWQKNNFHDDDNDGININIPNTTNMNQNTTNFINNNDQFNNYSNNNNNNKINTQSSYKSYPTLISYNELDQQINKIKQKSINCNNNSHINKKQKNRLKLKEDIFQQSDSENQDSLHFSINANSNVNTNININHMNSYNQTNHINIYNNINHLNNYNRIHNNSFYNKINHYNNLSHHHKLNNTNQQSQKLACSQQISIDNNLLQAQRSTNLTNSVNFNKQPETIEHKNSDSITGPLFKVQKFKMTDFEKPDIRAFLRKIQPGIIDSTGNFKRLNCSDSDIYWKSTINNINIDKVK